MRTAAQILVEARQLFSDYARPALVPINPGDPLGVRAVTFHPVWLIHMVADPSPERSSAQLHFLSAYGPDYAKSCFDAGANNRPHLDAFGRAIEACLGERK